MYITVKMHDAVLERPQKSGYYYTINTKGYHQVLHYSQQFDMFNEFDGSKDPGSHRIRVNWWSELLHPERGGELR